MPPQQDQLLNNGIVFLNEELLPGSEGTFVVLGAPRGGTSMVAGALHRLGIFMGHPLTEATYEDAALISAISNRKPEVIRKTIAERNSKYPIWGWKQPSQFDYFTENVAGLLRNPVFLVIYRDLLATANRNRIAVGSDVLASMDATATLYEKITRFVSKTASPVMLLSYEKALNNGSAFAAALADVTHVTDESKLRDAARFVQPSPPEYLARLHADPQEGEVIGHLDQVTAHRVAGWARAKQTPHPIRVHLYVNGKLVNAGLADQVRPDLKQQGLHPTGKCGFVIPVPANIVLRQGDEVRARAGEEGRDLMKSPWVFRS